MNEIFPDVYGIDRINKYLRRTYGNAQINLLLYSTCRLLERWKVKNSLFRRFLFEIMRFFLDYLSSLPIFFLKICCQPMFLIFTLCHLSEKAHS